MRDTTKKVEVSRTKSYASICNTYSSNSRTEDQILGNNKIVNYPFPLDNIFLINYKRYNNIKHNIGENKVDSASTLFYDLDTAAKKRPLNCTSELSFARREQAFFKYKRHRVKSKLKHNGKYCQTREYSKTSIVDSETDLNQSKNYVANDFKIFSNPKQTYILDADSYSKPHQHKEKHVKDEKLCYFTKYPKENSSPFITSRRKMYNTHKLPRRPSSTKMKTELDKNIKHSNALNKPSDISLRPSDKTKSLNNAILSFSTVKHKIHPYHKDTIDESITKVAQFSNQDSSYNLKYVCRNKNNRLRKRQITCPNCQEKVQLASTTDDDKECRYKNTNYNNSIEISEAMDYKYLSNNYKSDKFSRKGCRHGPRCHSPLSKMTSSCQIYEKFNPVTQITKACRQNAPCVMVPPYQKSESLQTHYKYLVDCSQSPICVSLPLCIPCKKTVNLNENSTKHIDDANNIEYQGTHCKFVPLCKHDIDINGMCTNNLEESHKSRDPYTDTFLMQTNISPPFRSYRPNPATSNCYKMDQSCQYVSFHSDTTNNMQVRTENAKSEGVIFIRDVGCQFRAKSNKNKNNFDQHLISQQSSGTVGEKNSTQSNQGKKSKRLRYEGNKMNHESEAEIESTDEDFVDESSHSVSSTHNNPPRNRTCGFVPTGNTSHFIAYTRTEPVLNKHSSGSTIKGEVPYSETLSNISPPRVLSRRNFLKQKYKRIFCARRRRRSRICSQDVNSSFEKMNQYKTIMT